MVGSAAAAVCWATFSLEGSGSADTVGAAEAVGSGATVAVVVAVAVTVGPGTVAVTVGPGAVTVTVGAGFGCAVTVIVSDAGSAVVASPPTMPAPAPIAALERHLGLGGGATGRG